MLYVLQYESVEDFVALAQENYPAHLARLQEFHGRGDLLFAGPLLDPMNGDAMAVFTRAEAVQEFVDGDPFVLNGVVARHTVRPYDGQLPGTG